MSAGSNAEARLPTVATGTDWKMPAVPTQAWSPITMISVVTEPAVLVKC
jgi:hypothetical protein